MNNIIKTFSDISDWNLGLHIWDDKNTVIENRKLLVSKLNKNLEDFIYMNQVHSGNVKVVNNSLLNSLPLQWKEASKDFFSCDWLVTNEKWVVLSVLVADCVPVLFFDNINWVIWVAHAGWKWAYKNIVQNTINQMLNIWANINDINIIIGPSINQCSYEVWEEVWVNFREEVKTELISWKQFLDLKKENKMQALELWIKEDNIEILNIDTFTDNNYFSARRDWFKKWRFGWFIYIK